MPAVSIDLLEVSNIAVTLRWTALTGSDTGGLDVDVDSYDLEWDQGTATWTALITLASTELSYTHSPPLSGGETYAYRIRATNEYGSALLFSEATEVQTAQVPETPSTPTVSISDLYVKVQWNQPFLNYVQLVKYEVLLEDINGDFIEVASLCDGSAYATLTNLYCLIPMNAFWDAPLSLD